MLSTGWAADALRAAGVPLKSLGERRLGGAKVATVFHVDHDTETSPAPLQVPPRRPWKTGERSLKNLMDLCPDAAVGEPTFPTVTALAELAEAVGRLSGSDDDARLADAEEEQRFLLETGELLGDGGSGVAARTACVAVCQGLFLAGLPGFDDAAAGPAWTGRVRWYAWLASVCAAAAPGLAVSHVGRWQLMHLAFFCGCGALAHARPEPFLLLGWALGVSLCFIAPPFTSGGAGRWGLWAGFGAFLAVFVAACWRDSLSTPKFISVAPVAVLMHFLARWLDKEGRAARVLWVLDGRRRRERAALWGALRELLPEYVLEGLTQGSQIEPHATHAVVLQAELEGICEGGQGAQRSAGARGPGEWGAAGAREVHELLTVLDREVPSCRQLSLPCFRHLAPVVMCCRDWVAHPRPSPPRAR